MSLHIKQEFYDWLATRPEVIQEMGKKYPPWLEYTMQSGKSCVLVEYCEDGTVTVNTKDMFGIPYGVFGVKPKELIVEEI